MKKRIKLGMETFTNVVLFLELLVISAPIDIENYALESI